MEPSPVWMVSVWPPPFILPCTADLLNVPSTVMGIPPMLMCPSPVVASMLAWKSAGSEISTLPSPVRKVQSAAILRSEEHTSELQSQSNLVCRLLLEKKNIYRRHHLPSDHTRRTP